MSTEALHIGSEGSAIPLGPLLAGGVSSWDGSYHRIIKVKKTSKTTTNNPNPSQYKKDISVQERH